MGFEGDVAKAKANIRDYGAGFEQAQGVFDDPDEITIADDEVGQP